MQRIRASTNSRYHPDPVANVQIPGHLVATEDAMGAFRRNVAVPQGRGDEFGVLVDGTYGWALC